MTAVLSPPSLTRPPTNDTFISTSSSSSFTPKRVSFCPSALLIQVAGEGEQEVAMVQAHQQQMGRRKVAVRTYSIETPHFGDVAGKAWQSVCTGFSASLEPFARTRAGSGSVCSSSPARPSSPEREHESSTSRVRSRSRSPTSRRSPCFSPALKEEEEEDPSFFPNPPTRLKLKLPTLKRECSLPYATSLCSRPVLRRTSCSSPPVSPTLDSLSPVLPPLLPSLEAAHSPSRSTPHLLPTLSRTLSTPSCSSLHPETGTIVPLSSCCKHCEAATLYGAVTDDAEYEEKWSPAALKRREEERAEREKRAECERDADEIAKQYREPTAVDAGKDGPSGEVEEKEAEEEEEKARGSRLAQLTQKGEVDEVSKAHRSHPSSPRPQTLRGDQSGEAAASVDDPYPDFGSLTDEPESLGMDNVSLDTNTPSTESLPSPSFAPLSPSLSAPPAIRLPASLSSNATPLPLPALSAAATPSPLPTRPSKRRFSSSAAASTSSSPPTTTSILTFSQRITAFGSSLLQGANSGLRTGV